MDKDYLTEGLNTDQELHTDIATEYNDKECLVYPGNVFASLKIGHKYNAGVFEKLLDKQVYRHLKWCVTSTRDDFRIGNYLVITENLQLKTVMNQYH